MSDDIPTFFKQTYADATWQARGKRRTRVKPISDKRRASFDLHDSLRRRVFERDGGCVLHGETPWDCGGLPLTVHHRRKAGAAGAWSMKNLVTLCAYHNLGIEDEPDYYRDNFPWLVVREGDAEWDELGVRG